MGWGWVWEGLVGLWGAGGVKNSLMLGWGRKIAGLF